MEVRLSRVVSLFLVDGRVCICSKIHCSRDEPEVMENALCDGLVDWNYSHRTSFRPRVRYFPYKLLIYKLPLFPDAHVDRTHPLAFRHAAQQQP